VRLLLDTCSFLWVTATPERIPKHVIDIVRQPDNIIFLSVSSAWEIAIKYKIQRLNLRKAPDLYIPDCVTQYDLKLLNVELGHVTKAGALPLHHQDPFDRLLIAQAQLEDLIIVTPDQAFAAYEVEKLW
jgi:PIN domain nuclease of toxin-antitoxin system